MKMKPLAVCILALLVLAGCTPKEPSVGYDDFEHIEHWDDLDRLQGERTIIYFYDAFCIICIQLEPEVTALLKQLEAHIEIFLINDAEVHDQGEPPFETFGVPSLIVFENQVFVEWISGSTPLLAYLEDEIDNLSNEGK